MCYSAQLKSAYDRFVREFGALVSMVEFARLYGFRLADERPAVRIPRAVDALFDVAEGAEVRELIERHRVEQAARWERELFMQRKRLADAERQLALKPTKAAAESRRIAGDKAQALLARIADLRRDTTDDAEDGRFFPGWWVPVLVFEHGQRIVRPMRYQCRPAGKPAEHDRRFPGTYNARRDSLGGYWKGLFGRSHGLVAIDAFYENVRQPDGKNQVLEFRPRAAERQEMLVACLWSRWVGPDGDELLSFAAITDEPPPEIAAAGHDRCIVPIRREHVQAWLDPDPKDLAAQQAILDDRERPTYEHRLAA